MGWLVTSKVITIFVLAILVLPASNVFAFSNGQAATVVVGQAGFTSSAAANPPTASTLSFPAGTTFDSSGNMWVADFGDNRVLEYTAPFSTGESASLVIGQTSFASGAANQGNAAPTASTFHFPVGIAFDSSGNMWVADKDNNRVLKYTAPFTTGQSASLVLGQTTFTSGASNQGLAAPTASTLSTPVGPTFDSSGNLWVTDLDNSRVLKYTAPFTTGQSASLVLGQTTFTSGAANQGLAAPTASTLNLPQAPAFDSSGNLWVTDANNNRVLKYTTPFSNGQSASLVLGQTTFTSNAANQGFAPTASTISFPIGLAFDSSGNFWIADAGNNRVLEYVTTTSGIQTTGQVTVLPTCGISLTSGAPINYGSLVPSSTSAEQTLILHNTGSVAATLSVHGTDWLDGSSNSQMLVGNTKFSTSTGTYASKTALTTSDQTVGTINPTPNLSTFWQLQANLLSSSFTGSLTQTMTFSNSC